jgi:hypothetical protein
MHIGIGGIAQTADSGASGLAAGIVAVAYGLFQIGIGQCLKNLGMDAFAVIVSEAVHKKLPAFRKQKFYKNLY